VLRAINYPRRQQYRRLARAVQLAILAAVLTLMAVAAAGAGLGAVALPLGAAGALLGVRARQRTQLARRSRIGARSEDRVRHELRVLEREGWRIMQSLRWHGGGDIDHVAIGPLKTGVAFAIETKTRSYTPADLERVSDIAGWLAERRRGWCRQAAIPVLCLAGTRGVERFESGVAVVSLNRLVPVLRRFAGTTPRPGFLR
jgi:hypothetical protein